MKTLKTVSFALLILFTLNCKKDDQLAPICTPIPDPDPDPIEYPFSVLDCDDVPATTAFLADLDEQGVFLRSFTQDTSHFILTFENDSIYGMAFSCLTDIKLHPEDWRYDLTYSEGTIQSLGYIGTINMESELNPSGYAPLTANLTVTAAEKGKVVIRVVGRNDDYYEVIKEFEDFSDEQTVPVLGLYSDYENLVEVSYLSEAGNLRVTDSTYILTEPLIPNLPAILITSRMEEQMEPGMNLVNYRFLVDPNVPLMMDAFGEVRWYLDYDIHPVLDKLDYIHGLKRLQNGNLYFLDATDEAIYEIDMFGTVLNSWVIPADYRMHHDLSEKADGNFLLTVSYLGSVHLNGNATKEDYVMEIDRQTGAAVMIWDLKESLDEYRITMEDNLANNPIDWLHLNSVLHDPTDNTIIVSGRQQGVFKIDYSNQVVWALGINTGWGQNRYGEDLSDFVLTAVDNNYQEIDEVYQTGMEDHPEFEWPWLQHAPLVLPNGNILLFDNGPFRNFGVSTMKYSRAVEYEINVADKTVRQVWQYGKERGTETWGRAGSDVDFHPGSNNVLFMPGWDVFNSNNQFGGKIVEVDYDSKQVVFEAEINSPGITFIQSERLKLYTD